LAEAEAADTKEAVADYVRSKFENSPTYRRDSCDKVVRVNQHRYLIWPKGWPPDEPPVVWQRRLSVARETTTARCRPSTWPLPSAVRKEIIHSDERMSDQSIVRFFTVRIAEMQLLVGKGVTVTEAAQQLAARWKGSPRFARFLEREFRQLGR
jgi:hypothetical protein